MYRAILLLAVAGCVLTGCVERRTAMHLRFDERSDMLHILYVHTHILGHDQAERDWLVKQWRWRDKLIPTVRFLGYIGYLRQSADSYQQIDLDAPGGNEPPTLKTDVPLGDIVIRPGEFFRGPDNALAYTHRVDFPGKALDALLQRCIDAAHKDWKEGIVAERERRKNGGKVFRWEDLREDLLAEVARWGTDAPPLVVPDDQQPYPTRCLSDESLGKLESALERKSALHREGNVLSFSLPLSETDRGQIISIFGEVQEKAVAKFKDKEVPQEMQKLIDDEFVSFVQDIFAKPGSDDLLILSCRLPRKLGLPAAESAMPPTAEEQTLQKETLMAIKAAGIPLRTDVRLADVVEKFLGGP